MATFFLVVIYITFISLGLPDSLLGSAWTVMRADFGLSLAAASPISMTVSAGTVISSLLSERMIKKFSTGPVTAVSVLLTAVALVGFSFAPGYGWLIVLAIPLGLGAGAIDAGLNNYVAVHYKPHHMSWLHCFWGVGALAGPLIMSGFLSGGGSWRGGYLTIGLIQSGLMLLLMVTLPLWKKVPARSVPEVEQAAPSYKGPVLRTPGVVMAMLVFFLYSGVEQSLNVWAASFFVEVRGVSAATAAGWASVFFLGITGGRLATGFLTMKMSNARLIRLGMVLLAVGVVILLLPLPGVLPLAGLVLAGLGCAPIFPCTLHETPVRFGVERSQKIMGIQMATAYVGTTVLSPIVGLVADAGLGIGVLPWFLLGFTALMWISSERVEAVTLRVRAAKARGL